MKPWRAALLVGVAIFSAASIAATASDRPGDAAFMLSVASTGTVERTRGNCAAGQAANYIAKLRQAGIADLPDMTVDCVSALTRLGRDGTLGYVRDPSHPGLTPALAFDNGFVSGYRKREPLTGRLPSMAMLKPTAEQCLAQANRDTDLCFSAGYVYGARAANGETFADN